MRIIGGSARSREIMAPKGMSTRPVTDLIRESLFDIWQFKVVDARFLDLFAGSGCMGLEALSRGAASVVMVDASPEAVRVIRTNLQRTKLGELPNEVHKADVFDVISKFGRLGRTFDIVYLDPPFTQPEMFPPLMEALADGRLLATDGVIAIRSRDRLKMPEAAGVLTKVREKRYGISTVHFYQVEQADDAGEVSDEAESQATE